MTADKGDSGTPKAAGTSASRVVTVSLYNREMRWLDQLTKLLQRGGNPKANRSFVVREALLRLEEAVRGKDPGELVRDFAEHHARRVAADPTDDPESKQ